MNTKNERILQDVKRRLATLDIEPAVRDAADVALRSLASGWKPAMVQGNLKSERMTNDLGEVIDTLQFLRRQIEMASREQALLPVPRRMVA